MSKVGAALSESLSTSLFLKVASFAISVATVRISSVADYGKVSVNFQLLTSMAMFVLKEGFRRCALKAKSRGMEMMLFGVILTALVFIPSITLIYAVLFEPMTNLPLLVTIAVSLEIEAVAELYLFHQAGRDMSVRNRADTWSSLARSVLMLAVLYMTGNGTAAFAASQLASALVVLFVPLSLDPKIPFPIKSVLVVVQQKTLRTPLLEMCTMAVQKLVLAEGERILSLMYLSPEEIGLVSMVSNLGSLVLRLVFAPIEEIAFTAFAVPRSSEESKKHILKSVVLVETSVGFLSALFGPPLCEAVLTVLYGTKWVEATYLLQTYSLMILVFALNGCFEAYFFAVANSKRMRYSFVAQWAAFGSLFASVSLTADWGPIAILIGNSVSMIVRIVWASTSFSKVSDPVHPAALKVIRNIVIGAIVSAIAVTTVRGTGIYLELLIGGLVALITVLSILRTLRNAITDIDRSKRI